MHELSLAQNIVSVIHEYVPEDRRSQVETVTVKVGDQAGVVADSLEFCFSAIIAGTPLSAARLSIEHVPFVIACNACNATSSNDAGIMLCDQCGSTETKILSGTELQVKEIELRDQPVETP